MFLNQLHPNLAFASNGHVYRQLHRRILEKFRRSQHRPSLIKSSKTAVSLPSESYKRWNFRKAKWKKYTRITNRLARDLPSTDITCVRKPTKTSATPSSTQQKNHFHAVVGKNTDHAGMRSARPSTSHSFGHRRVKALTQLPLPFLPDLIKGEGNANQRQSTPLTLRTPAGWHGML